MIDFLKEFFQYYDPFSDEYAHLLHKPNFFEWFFPLFFVALFIALIVVFKRKIQENEKLDRILRFTFGFVLGFFFFTHYILKWSIYGFTIDNLPFQLCAVSMFLTTILAFTKSKSIQYFVVFTGVLGGLGSMISPDVGFSYQYFRYYQFMFGHGLIIVIPIYFMVIHRYIPNKKELLKTMAIVQVLAIIMLVFNTKYNTSYLYVKWGADISHEGTILAALGGWPWFLLNIEILAISLFLLWFGLIKLIFNDKEDEIKFNLYFKEKKKSMFQKNA